MATLSEEVKHRVVVELASFRSAPEVVKIIEEEFGEKFEPRDLIRYDATKTYFNGGQGLRALFEQTRKEFVEGVSSVPITQEAYRLRRLQRLSELAEKAGDLKLAAEIIERAAKDFGGLFTNVRQVSGKLEHTHMTADQARERVAAFKAKHAASGETAH